MQRAVVRSAFEMNSKAAGKPLKIGQVITALEAKVNEKGITRVRYEDGWISEKAGDGTVLLEKVAEKGGAVQLVALAARATHRGVLEEVRCVRGVNPHRLFLFAVVVCVSHGP